jgi:hypothetical protein
VRHSLFAVRRRRRTVEQDPGSVPYLWHSGTSRAEPHGRGGGVTDGSGGRVGAIGVGVGVAGTGVGVGGFVGAAVGAAVRVGEAVGAGVGGAVWTCAGADVAGAGLGLAGASVPLLPVDAGASEGTTTEGPGASDGTIFAVAEGAPLTVSATSLVAVKAASAKPMASAGPSTRYSANDARTGRPLMAPRARFESLPTPTRDKDHSCGPIFRCRYAWQWQRRVSSGSRVEPRHPGDSPGPAGGAD